MPHKGASTQRHNQQVLAKPHHQPSDRPTSEKETTTKSENQKLSVHSSWRRGTTNHT